MKKTVCKVIGIIFMVSALILTQIPALGTKASSSVNDGFMMDGTKLVEYTGTANAVSVPDDVKTIGAEAFAENTVMTSVALPKNLETIENGAFSGCTQLRQVTVPDGCKAIENGAFADCDRLEYVSLPASLISLGTSVFAGCDMLSYVNIDERNQYFYCKDGVIYNNKTTAIYQYLAGYPEAQYNMPNSVEEIKKYAFWGCSNLKEVNVSSQLKEVGDYAFSNASGLENIVLPYSVRAIRRKGFEDCINLKYTTIPISVTSIDETAFDGCYQLRIKAEAGSRAEEFYENLEATKAANAEYEDSVSQNAVNSHWQKDQNEENKTAQTARIPYASDVEHYVEWDVDSPGVLGRSKVVSGQAVVLFSSGDSEVQGGTDSVSSDDLTVDEETLRQSIIDGKTIAYKAFYGDKNLSHIQIPNSVYTIGGFSFARSGLKEIVIPNGVKTIENAAFYHCDALKKVSIPASVSEIGEDAFADTLWMNDWMSDDSHSDFLIAGDGILLAYKGNADQVTIPAGVKQIGAGAFRGHSEILQVSVPDSVTRIGENAFYDCSSLKTVTGMNSVSEIEDRAFYLCPLTTVRIPESVKEIGVSAFGGTGLTDSVVFLGTKLPAFTYQDSSTRLSEQRQPVFDGITTAIVDASIKQYSLKDTVLDTAMPGFRGIIYNVNSGGTNIATPVISTGTEGETTYPDTIYMYGKAYRVNQPTNVYYAESKPEDTNTALQDLLVVDHSKLKKEDVSISQSGSTVDMSGYHFYVSDSGLGTKELTTAIQKNYGATDASNSFFIDLSMYDPYDAIPIKYLGKNTLTVTMPVPTDLIGKELCIITLDRNKNPEILLGSLSVKDDRQYISFDVSHFSPYAIYAPEGELKEQIKEKWENSSNTYGLDDTPDTGDYVNIRLIFLIGLFAMGGFLLLLGFRDIPRLNRKKK